ncbi:MAG: hypothetical protein ACI8RD_007410 [Bacillariaceae sp.]|jgi:hypothetical protein
MRPWKYFLIKPLKKCNLHFVFSVGKKSNIYIYIYYSISYAPGFSFPPSFLLITVRLAYCVYMREYRYHSRHNNRNNPLCDLSLQCIGFSDCNYKINAIIIEDAAAAAPTVTANKLPRDPEVSVVDVVSDVVELVPDEDELDVDELVPDEDVVVELVDD